MNCLAKFLCISSLLASTSLLSNVFEAARTGNVARLAQLIHENNTLINAEDHAKNTLLHTAAINNQPAVVTFLLHAHIDVINQKNINGNTALHFAALVGNQQIVNALLQAGANPYIKNNAGKTAADTAEKNGNHVLARFIRTHKKAAQPTIEKE